MRRILSGGSPRIHAGEAALQRSGKSLASRNALQRWGKLQASPETDSRDRNREASVGNFIVPASIQQAKQTHTRTTPRAATNPIEPAVVASLFLKFQMALLTSPTVVEFLRRRGAGLLRPPA